MSAGSEEGGAQGVPLGAVCGRSGFAGGEKYYIITYCQERRKWGIPKKFFEKSRRKRLTARRCGDKFPLLRRGEILVARSEKKLRGSKKSC